MTNSSPEKTPSQRRVFGVLAFGAIILLLWPLSLGPVVWLYDRGYMSDQTAQIIGVLYQPLSWLMESSPIVEDLVMHYLGLWRP